MTLSRRPAALTSILRSRVAPTFRRSVRRQGWQHVQSKGYASEGGHGEQSTVSELMYWGLPSAAVTILASYYLLQQTPARDHGHHGEHGDAHDEAHGEKHEDGGEGEEAQGPSSDSVKEESGEEGKSDDREESGEKGKEGDDDDSKEEGKSDKSDSGKDEKTVSPDTPGDSDGEETEAGSGKKVEGVKFKGSTKAGETGDTREHIPDAKGGNKKRITSDAGKKLGEGEDNDGEEDKPASSKPAASFNMQSGKQEGLSNTDTKHSTDIEHDPEKSTKGEGTPESSKGKGTVDPTRTQK